MALFSESFFGFWKPSTQVIPKKGMLIKPLTYEYCKNDEYSNGVRWRLIITTIVDEYNNCKFEMLGDQKTQWTDWMTTQEFNHKFEIKNPWI